MGSSSPEVRAGKGRGRRLGHRIVWVIWAAGLGTALIEIAEEMPAHLYGGISMELVCQSYGSFMYNKYDI